VHNQQTSPFARFNVVVFFCSEYITTLETDIAERDRLIDAIRSELGSTKSENNALRQEIDTLKKSLLAAQPSPILPPPAPLPIVSAAASVAVRNTTTPSPPLLAPNTNKDLPSSPRLAGTRAGFWGGQGSSPFGTMGGFTPVHTTLVPEWSISGALAGKGLVTPPDSPPFILSQRSLQENINPALNNTNDSAMRQQPGNLQQANQFDSFTDVNPFTMKTLDMYRTHLWTKLIQQRAPQRQQKQTNSQSPPLTGLAANLRPQYFAATGKQSPVPANTSSSLSTLLSGKGIAGSYPSPPPYPQIASVAPTKVTPQEAALASLASQTLISKLGSAFWDAFAGQSSGSCPLSKAVDVDKVRRVLEGKAVLKIVDIDEPLSSRPSPSSPKVMASSPKVSPPTSPKLPVKSTDKCDKCKDRITDILEESMKSLSISKRGAY
jgi:bZIP-type transcription factor MBZ1